LVACGLRVDQGGTDFFIHLLTQLGHILSQFSLAICDGLVDVFDVFLGLVSDLFEKKLGVLL